MILRDGFVRSNHSSNAIGRSPSPNPPRFQRLSCTWSLPIQNSPSTGGIQARGHTGWCEPRRLTFEWPAGDVIGCYGLRLFCLFAFFRRFAKSGSRSDCCERPSQDRRNDQVGKNKSVACLCKAAKDKPPSHHLLLKFIGIKLRLHDRPLASLYLR